jgi:aspartyl/asparaginyl beta-hydroxylase (cupin superfamily)
VYGIYAFGRKLEENAKKCPETTKLIESIPGVTTAGFSLMTPGTHITPHKGYEGYSEHVLRLHLGLVCPEECYLRVGRETKTWKKGETLIFDDFMTHEAWNDGKSTRIILLLDFKYNKYGLDPDVYGADFTEGLSGLLSSIDQGKMK